MVATCLCLIRRDTATGPQVLLGYKKTGFGAGRVVGLGGHIEAGEEPAQAAAREVAEESSLVVSPAALEHRARIDFRFPHRPAWDMIAEVFLTGRYRGEAAESDEVAPRWYGLDALPFDGMWDDARYWLPRVLAGEHLDIVVTFAADCATVAAIEPPLTAARGPGTAGP